jgi:hypothetical protein
LAVQFIADPTRLYRVTASLGSSATATGDTIRCFLTTDTNVELKQASTEYLFAAQGTQLHLEHLMTGSGLTSLKLRVARLSGSGTVSVLRDLPIFNSFLTVEDIAGLPSPYVIAGGASSDVFTDIGGTIYRVITFASNGELQVLNGDISEMEYLIVGGGGGGGGGNVSGGGGAGGLLTNLGSPIGVSSGIYGVTVGTGGAGGAGGADGASGGDSSALGVTAFGGGGGRQQSLIGISGGSGGGARGNTAFIGGSGVAGQGNKGGDSGLGLGSGGGGGASTAGAGASTTAFIGGNGGNGTSNSITGTAIFYAGGGGGGASNLSNTVGISGTNGLGGGGGGGSGGGSVDRVGGTGGQGGGGRGGDSTTAVGSTGGNGGSGIVIVRFPYVGFQ